MGNTKYSLMIIFFVIQLFCVYTTVSQVLEWGEVSGVFISFIFGIFDIILVGAYEMSMPAVDIKDNNKYVRTKSTVMPAKDPNKELTLIDADVTEKLIEYD